MRGLEAWIREFVMVGRRLKTITFWHCREDLQNLLEIIVDEKLVDEAYWKS
jgi:hypothetical protein